MHLAEVDTSAALGRSELAQVLDEAVDFSGIEEMGYLLDSSDPKM